MQISLYTQPEAAKNGVYGWFYRIRRNGLVVAESPSGVASEALADRAAKLKCDELALGEPVTYAPSPLERDHSVAPDPM